MAAPTIGSRHFFVPFICAYGRGNNYTGLKNTIISPPKDHHLYRNSASNEGAISQITVLYKEIEIFLYTEIETYFVPTALLQPFFIPIIGISKITLYLCSKT